MTKKKRQNGKAKASDGLPWFIRTDQEVGLVWKMDPALAPDGFPESYIKRMMDVAPRELVECLPGKEPTVFHVRTMTRDEQMLIYGIMAEGAMNGDSSKQFVFLMNEAAKKCIKKVTLPDGTVFTKAKLDKHYGQFFGTIAAAIGSFVINESVRDPLG